MLQERSDLLLVQGSQEASHRLVKKFSAQPAKLLTAPHSTRNQLYIPSATFNAL
jgi:hypothetical protein